MIPCIESVTVPSNLKDLWESVYSYTVNKIKWTPLSKALDCDTRQNVIFEDADIGLSIVYDNALRDETVLNTEN